MARLIAILLLSTVGGSFIIHFLKNFLLKERIKFHPDWDGLIERLCITYIIAASPRLFIFIPVVIILKALYRLSFLIFTPGLGQTTEPGAASQKVLLKTELALDLFLSPAFAILVGIAFK